MRIDEVLPPASPHRGGLLLPSTTVITAALSQGIRVHVCTCLLTPRLPPGKMPLFLWTVGVCHCDEKQLSAHGSRSGSVTLDKSVWKLEEAKPITSIVKSRGWGEGDTWVQFPEPVF